MNYEQEQNDINRDELHLSDPYTIDPRHFSNI